MGALSGRDASDLVRLARFGRRHLYPVSADMLHDGGHRPGLAAGHDGRAALDRHQLHHDDVPHDPQSRRHCDVDRPFSDTSALKQAAGATHAVPGSIITFDDRSAPPSNEVSTFLLPADLPPGYYELLFESDFGNGSSTGSRSIVRVGAQ